MLKEKKKRTRILPFFGEEKSHNLVLGSRDAQGSQVEQPQPWARLPWAWLEEMPVCSLENLRNVTDTGTEDEAAEVAKPQFFFDGATSVMLNNFCSQTQIILRHYG